MKRHETQVSRHETQDASLMSKSLISNTPSLCNIQITPNKKGDCSDSYHPNLLRIDPYVLVAQRSSRRIILVILILITKTLQMYVFF